MTIKQTALSYAERIWNNQDLTAIDDLLDDKCTIHSLLGNSHGKEYMKTVVKTWLNAFPDLQVKNTAIICENDLVVIHWQAQGTHLGEFKGIPATHKPISYAGVTIYRIIENKITEYWAYLDIQHIIEQIS